MELEMARDKLANEQETMREMSTKVKRGREEHSLGEKNLSITAKGMELTRLGTPIGPFTDPKGIGGAAKFVPIVGQREQGTSGRTRGNGRKDWGA
jgi:hypothetical protein